MRFEKIWIEQCGATKAIKRRFGAKSALDYLVGEKLMAFADAADDHPPFAKELLDNAQGNRPRDPQTGYVRFAPPWRRRELGGPVMSATSGAISASG